MTSEGIRTDRSEMIGVAARESVARKKRVLAPVSKLYKVHEQAW